jgi:hypothetical protein
MKHKQKQILVQLRKKKKGEFLLQLLQSFVAVTTGYFVITKGFTYVKDTIIGNSSKLLEGEWIKVPRNQG